MNKQMQANSRKALSQALDTLKQAYKQTHEDEKEIRAAITAEVDGLSGVYEGGVPRLAQHVTKVAAELGLEVTPKLVKQTRSSIIMAFDFEGLKKRLFAHIQKPVVASKNPTYELDFSWAD